MSETKKEYNIWTSFTDGIRKYFKLQGRANRYEYWGFVLMTLMILVGYFFISKMITLGLAPFIRNSLVLVCIVYGLFIIDVLMRLFLLIPSITIAVRRMHDINKSGWWIFLTLGMVLVLILLVMIFSILEYSGIDVAVIIREITFIAGGLAIIISFLYVLYLLCKKSVDGNNRYGEPNKEAKEDKYGIKFIWIYFCLIFIPYIIIFAVSFHSGYSKAMKKYEMQRNTQEYFIPQSEFDNMQTIEDEEVIIIDDEEVDIDIEEDIDENIKGNIQEYSF